MHKSKENFLQRLLLLPFLLCLQSCEMDVQVDLKLKRIIKFISDSTSEPIYIKGKIFFETSGDKECNEKKEEYESILSSYFKNIKNSTCQGKEMKTFFQAETEIPIYKQNEKASELPSELLAVIVKKFGTGFRVGLTLSKSELSNLNRTVSDKYFSSIKSSDVSVEFNITNNLEKDVKWKAHSIYVDNNPHPISEEFLLKQDEDVNVKISGIMRDFIFEKGSSYFMVFDNTLVDKK